MRAIGVRPSVSRTLAASGACDNIVTINLLEFSRTALCNIFIPFLGSRISASSGFILIISFRMSGDQRSNAKVLIIFSTAWNALLDGVKHLNKFSPWS